MGGAAVVGVVTLDLAPARSLLNALHQDGRDDPLAQAANAALALLIADVQRLQEENARLKATIARLRRPRKAKAS